MQLTLHQPGTLRPRQVAADGIQLGADWVRHSIVLYGEKLQPLAARHLDELDTVCCEQIAALGAEIVILGTGPRFTMPVAALRAWFLSRRIGLEAMDNAAAARTWTVLQSEGRDAAVVFLLPG
ncbi:MAG: MTH938/NDUFAF3 family protein [Xanthomonadales bacterium]|jgi:uncharacterized protein|nr:MTH938/NDUFAF3 family protein [Xanthomonadales bacterium]